MLQSQCGEHIYSGTGVVVQNKKIWILTAGHCTAVHLGGQPTCMERIRVAIPRIKYYHKIKHRNGRIKKKSKRFRYFMVVKENIYNYPNYMDQGNSYSGTDIGNLFF